MTRRRLAAAALTTAALVAALAEAWRSYGGRERPGRPTAEALELLATAEPNAVAIWLAYPHQNLGRLAERVGSVRRWLDDVRGGSGDAGFAPPAFGPFEIPPASELAAVRSADGEGRLVLRAYAPIRWLARAAGVVAGNPWLAGGEVELDSGRRGRVSWRAGCWWLETVTLPAGRRSASRPPEDSTPALGLLVTGRPFGPLPAGGYRLQRGPRGLELLAGEPPPPLAAWPAAALAPAAWKVEVAPPDRLAALVVWEAESPVPPFPASAGAARREAERPRLPGEELLRFAGLRPARSRAGGLEVHALTAEWLAPAEALARAVSRRLRAHPDLGLLAGADPGKLGRLSRRLAEGFRGLPAGALIGVDPARLADLLAPWETCGLSQIEVWRAPERVRWRLCEATPRASPR